MELRIKTIIIFFSDAYNCLSTISMYCTIHSKLESNKKLDIRHSKAFYCTTKKSSITPRHCT